jgi:putative two-component system response regulator
VEILIVEDDPIARELLKNAVLEMGYDAICTTNGREALAALTNSSCRFVISDWVMPEMDGIELCQTIRREDLGRYVYIILLTGRDRGSEKVKALSAGADDFMAKPLDPAELAVRIRAADRLLALESRDVTIFALARLAESRDPETGAHLERVRTYSRTIAEDLRERGVYSDEVSPQFVRLIYATSPLHDIGKVSIPDHVLLKPGRLTDREFAIMKTHTTMGAETLNAALEQYPGAEFLRMARDIAASHHERFDGDGYPQGLAGTDIPLSGRIMMLADVYDALVSKRVYKDAFGHDVARSIILDEEGQQFDPEIIASFLRCEDRFVDTMDRYAEAA